MEYCSIRQISEKWGISIRRIQVLCAEERVPGAVKLDIHGQFLRMLRSQKMPE